MIFHDLAKSGLILDLVKILYNLIYSRTKIPDIKII